MDRKKFQKQARVLRNKRLASKAVRTTITVKKGVVKVDSSITKKPKNNSRLAPPSKAEIQRTRHERILAQRKDLLRRKAKTGGGCSGCRRKLGGK